MSDGAASPVANRASGLCPDIAEPAPSSAKAHKLRVFLSNILEDDRKLQIALLIFMVLFYGGLLMPSFLFSRLTNRLDLIFNDMLSHLLRGRFDIDPDIAEYECYLRNGRYYVYWGIWCALIRLPLWAIRRMNLDVTLWSCLAAVCVATMAKVRVVLLLRQRAMHSPLTRQAIRFMLIFILFGSSAIGFLKTSVYQEEAFWGAAFADLFVLFAMRGLVFSRFDLPTRCWMALFAGLALVSRVSIGAGLALALLLLLFVIGSEQGVIGEVHKPTLLRRVSRTLLQPQTALPLGLVSVFGVIDGLVNFFRWGNPLTVVNYLLARDMQFYPAIQHIVTTYGLFNLRRLPFTVVYYLFPVWIFHDAHGQLLFAQTQSSLFVTVDLPPSSPLLADLLPICFVVFFVVGLWRRQTGRLLLGPSGAIAAGLLAPWLLNFTCLFLTYRYRLDFEPEISFLAFLGLYLVVSDKAAQERFARCRRWFGAALAVSVVSSFAMYALFNLSWLGTQQEELNAGIVQYYLQAIALRWSDVLSHISGFHHWL